MRHIYSVIKKPLFTEKGAAMKEAGNKLLVEVDMDANKIEIKRAFEEIFKVKVEKVATVIVPSKKKRWGKSVGTVPERKKAIVTLKEGQKLDFIEGA